MMGFYDSAATEAAVPKLEPARHRRQSTIKRESGQLVLP